MEASELQIPALRNLNPAKAVGGIVVITAGVCALLVWLLKTKPAASLNAPIVNALPAINAGFNLLSTILLINGYVAIRNRRISPHIKSMLGALASSAAFVVGYVIYHAIHGDTKFAGTGVIRATYLLILVSHILLSPVALLMVLTSLYLALSGKLAVHRKVSRFTLPLWLYVSVTGVVIFVMLKAYNG